MKLKRSSLRKLIVQEVNRMEEDSLRKTYDDSDRQSYYSRNNKKQPSCTECGSAMYEGDDICEKCGHSHKDTMINESGCGCGDSTSAFPISNFSNLDDTNITPGEAFGVGYEAAEFDNKKDFFGKNALSMAVDFPEHPEIKKHGHNNYMAKPSLYKIAKYAQKLLAIIPDGYELDDWQRTKIAQISDDISEVYHSLDYDKHKGDL